jgi:hypothetical protein
MQWGGFGGQLEGEAGVVERGRVECVVVVARGRYDCCPGRAVVKDD